MTAPPYQHILADVLEFSLDLHAVLAGHLLFLLVALSLLLDAGDDAPGWAAGPHLPAWKKNLQLKGRTESPNAHRTADTRLEYRFSGNDFPAYKDGVIASLKAPLMARCHFTAVRNRWCRSDRNQISPKASGWFHIHPNTQVLRTTAEVNGAAALKQTSGCSYIISPFINRRLHPTAVQLDCAYYRKKAKDPLCKSVNAINKHRCVAVINRLQLATRVFLIMNNGEGGALFIFYYKKINGILLSG